MLIQLPSTGAQPEGIEISQFNCAAPPGADTNTYLGIVVEGNRGDWNYQGKRTESIISLPYRNGVYDYWANGEDDIHEYGGNGTNVRVLFVYDNGPASNPQYVPITFNQKYQFKIAIMLKR